MRISYYVFATIALKFHQVSTKKLNWQCIPVKNIQKTTFWAKTKELEMESPELLESLSEEFAAKAAKGLSSEVADKLDGVFELLQTHLNRCRNRFE